MVTMPLSSSEFVFWVLQVSINAQLIDLFLIPLQSLEGRRGCLLSTAYFRQAFINRKFTELGILSD